MKRRLFILIMLLAGGAIVNVAVAWGAVFTYYPRGERQFSGAEATQRWDRLDLPWNPPGEAWGWDNRLWGWRITTLGRPVQFAGTHDAAGLWMVISGCPCDTMYGVSAGWHNQRFHRGDWQRPDLLPLPDVLMLPTAPIWRGFAINTVFYAALTWGLLWAAFAAPGVLRTRSRIRRGLCPKCAYDLRGTTGGACPECDAASSMLAGNRP